MIYTLCQRLVGDDSIGFNYSYMGSAEYEFGATVEARKHLNDASELVQLTGQIKDGKRRFDCTFTVSKSDIVAAKELIEIFGRGDFNNKGPMAYTEAPLGWLVLDPVVMLVCITSDENAARATQFLDHAKQMFAQAGD